MDVPAYYDCNYFTAHSNTVAIYFSWHLRSGKLGTQTKMLNPVPFWNRLDLFKNLEFYSLIFLSHLIVLSRSGSCRPVAHDVFPFCNQELCNILSSGKPRKSYLFHFPLYFILFIKI